MADSTEINMVVEYALGNRKRLNVALSIYDAYDEIRRPIITKFILDLKDEIASVLNSASEEWGIEVRPDEDWTLKRDCRLRVRHLNWQQGQYVGIGAGRYGPNDLWFGVWGIADESVDLLSQLNQRVPGGWAVPNSNPPLQWCYNFGNLFDQRWEFGDWRRSATIFAMHEGKGGEYHRRIRDKILAIAHATDEILRGVP